MTEQYYDVYVENEYTRNKHINLHAKYVRCNQSEIDKIRAYWGKDSEIKMIACDTPKMKRYYKLFDRKEATNIMHGDKNKGQRGIGLQWIPNPVRTHKIDMLTQRKPNIQLVNDTPGVLDIPFICFAKEDIFLMIGEGTELYEVIPQSEMAFTAYIKYYAAEQIQLKYIGHIKDNIDMLLNEGAIYYHEHIKKVA